jgi:hypothetical protein
MTPGAMSLPVIEPSLILAPVTELLARSAVVIEPFLICFPVITTAATPVEALEITIATDRTITLVKDGLDNLISPLGVCLNPTLIRGSYGPNQPNFKDSDLLMGVRLPVRIRRAGFFHAHIGLQHR